MKIVKYAVSFFFGFLFESKFLRDEVGKCYVTGEGGGEKAGRNGFGLLNYLFYCFLLLSFFLFSFSFFLYFFLCALNLIAVSVT